MDKQKPVVYIGMSGGVDSSVAAYILQKEGYIVNGIYANCFYDDAQCRNSIDHADAVKVSSKLGVKLDTNDYRVEYRDNVLKYFYDNYQIGKTPNPDILCNSQIKFGVMASDVFKREPHAYLATGHYVSNRPLDKIKFLAYLKSINSNIDSIHTIEPMIDAFLKTETNFLFSGIDETKDQSYFLYQLYAKPNDMSKYLFPLGEMRKSEVRQIAKNILPDIADKSDSQGICFVGDIKLREFIKDHIKTKTGDVFNTNGELIGSHSGVQFYTIGQRHGFSINTYTPEPYYIVYKILDKNTLIVGRRSEAYKSKFKITDVVFPINLENYIETFNDVSLSVRVRNLGKKIPCKVIPSSDRKSFEVELLEPEFGIAPGQSAVFYLDRLMLGGGIIDASIYRELKNSNKKIFSSI